MYHKMPYDEFIRYYTSTYIGIKDKNKLITPVYVRGVGVNNGSVAVQMISKSGIRKPAEVIYDQTEWCTHSGLGNINTEDFFVYIYMYAYRQWQKGINDQIYKRFNPFSMELNILDRDINIFQLIWNRFNPTYYSLDHGLYLLTNMQRFAVALSPTIGLGLKFTCKNVCLFYKNILIGELLDTKTKEVRIKNSCLHLKEQVTPFFNIV